MEKSATLKEIGKALSLFQTKMEKIKKDSTNPFFNKKYASLSTILENIQIPLAECELAFSQLPDGDCLTTILIHCPTGEFLQSCYNIHAAKVDPQGIGSAITYARRYALTAILGLNVDDDDDGNSATKPEKQYTAQPQKASEPISGKMPPNTAATKDEGDQRPWLSEKQYEQAIARINDGEIGLLPDLMKTFRMKRAYREALEQAEKLSNSLQQ